MRRSAWIFLLFSLLSSACPAEKLVIAAEDAAEPWSKPDGSGFANDVVRAAFAASGVEVEFSVMPYARCKEMVLNGSLAAGLSMSWLDEFKGRIRFSEEPLFVCQSDYFVSTQHPLKALSEEALSKGTLLGIVRGYEYPASVYRMRDQGVIVFEESESEAQNLKKLALGRIDAALLNHNSTRPAQWLLQNAGVSGQVKRAFRSGTLKSFIGFSTRHPRGRWARKRFDDGYSIISADGRLLEIEWRWHQRLSGDAAGGPCP